MTTTNLAEFGYREKELLVKLLQAELKQGLPLDFYKSERKTHPSFLRGWDVSDKNSELTL